MHTLVTLLPTAIVLTAAIILLFLGIRGRRTDDHPVCRKCGFDLFGVYPTIAVCPECGTGLAERGRVLVGHRGRRRRLLVIGVILLLGSLSLAGMLAADRLAGFDAAAIKPAWLLSHESGGADAKRAQRAVQELTFRLAQKLLSQERVRELVEKGLKYRGAPSASPLVSWDWGIFIESAYVAGLVSDGQFQRYIDTGLFVQPVVRSQMAPGEPLTLGVRFAGCLASVAGFIVMARSELVQIDGVDVDVGGMTGFYRMDTSAGAELSKQIDLPIPEGRHTARLRWRFQLQRSYDASDFGLYTWTVEKVLPLSVEAGAGLAMRVTPALRKQVRESITLGGIAATRGTERAAVGSLQVSFPPFNLAFDILLKVGEQEFPLGTITAPAGPMSNAWQNFRGPIDEAGAAALDAGTAMIVLRPSRKAAAALLDVRAIWGEEIEIDPKTFLAKQEPEEKPARGP